METVEVCNFTLATPDISNTLPTSNSIGTLDQWRIYMTWYNINIKNMLGDLYDQYECFNLRLNALTQHNQGAHGDSADDRLVMIRMSGLPFINNTYNTLTKVNENEATLGTFLSSTSGNAVSFIFDSANVATFRRCENVNISIRLQKYDGTVPVTTTNPFPRMVFYFNIIPIGKKLK